MTVQKQNAEMLDLLAPTFQKRNEPNFAIGNAIPTFQQIPGLRGLWCASLLNESLSMLDLSLQGRTLTQTGTPTRSQSGLVPYVAYDGATQYHSRADEAGLDITGSFTAGGWFYITSLVAEVYPMSKYNTTGDQRTWQLRVTAAGTPVFYISSDGTAGGLSAVVGSAGAISINTWVFLVGRFFAGAQLDILYNDQITTNLVGIPASVFNSTANFSIAGSSGAAGLPGRCWMGFLSAVGVPYTILRNVYEQTRAAFGV